MRIAILASQNGTNAQAIAEATKDGRLDAEVAVILTNKETAGVIGRARTLGVPLEILPSKGMEREQYDRLLVQTLEKYHVDTIALAGWMRILSDEFLKAYEGRILNIHPALLPSFSGKAGIDCSYQYGVKLAGCTVHIVNPVLDGGPIVIQAAIPVNGTVDELESRIHKAEHLIFPQALQWMAEGRLAMEGRTVKILPSDSPKKETAIVDGMLISPALESLQA